MKSYLMFLEEKGLAEWNDYFDDWHFHTDNIYAPELIEEFKEQQTSKHESRFPIPQDD